ncbi:MAG: helix-turn-helix transcriptional regulator [Allosphingosinicella sp.]|uniref:helix-turn-helix transcriptional regulator n=1 Tax=Allosphingosinicella sp. TaxID=2823234 RepID=UPI003936CA8D
MLPFSCAGIIFEAAGDDDAFGALAGQVAEALNARSGVVHWRHLREGREEVSYSGYFSAEQMARFSTHFADEDIWSKAVRAPAARNRAWALDTLVPGRAYERSRIYNEWIRPMGDDTFHCLGAVVAQDDMVAELGFHRGRGQPAFAAEEVAFLNGELDHFRRLMKVRHKLSASRRAQEQLEGTSDAIGYGIFTLDARGTLLHHNRAAEIILERGDGLLLRGGRLVARTPREREPLNRAIEQAAAEPLFSTALRVGRGDGDHYEVSVLTSEAGGRRQIVIVTADPDAADPSIAARLRALFKLSSAEAEIAVALANGASIAEMALARRTSIGTIRSQVKSVSAKLGCGRQSEIVALVARLPRLSAMRQA